MEAGFNDCGKATAESAVGQKLVLPLDHMKPTHSCCLASLAARSEHVQTSLVRQDIHSVRWVKGPRHARPVVRPRALLHHLVGVDRDCSNSEFRCSKIPAGGGAGGLPFSQKRRHWLNMLGAITKSERGHKKASSSIRVVGVSLQVVRSDIPLARNSRLCKNVV